MSTKVEAPEITEEERELQASQKELLDLQRDLLQRTQQQQELLMPVLLSEFGIDAQFDDAGNITGFAKTDDPAQTLREELELDQLEFERASIDEKQELESLLRERQSAALKGELPLDPGLLRDLEEGETTLRDTLRRQLGTGFETSTPGIEALATFSQRSIEIKDAARRGDITLAQQLGLSREAANRGSGQSAGAIARDVSSQLFDRSSQAVLGQPLSLSQGLGGGASSFGSALSGRQQDRNMELQAAIAQAQAKASLIGGIASGVGSIVGGALT